MKKSYKFIFKDNKYESYKKYASFLFLINAIVFIAFGLRSISISNQVFLFTSALVLIVYAVYHWAYKKKKEKSYIAAYILLAVIWISNTSFWYFSIPLLLLPALQFRMESDFTISISVQHIIINGFLNKHYRWPDFNNIILKDDLLTLDFTTNKILQIEPDWNMSIEKSGIEPLEAGEGYTEREQEFNDFCRQQLNK